MGVHSSSIYRNRYIHNGYSNMESVYKEFQYKLDNQYPFDQRFPICNHSSFIDIMAPL